MTEQDIWSFFDRSFLQNLVAAAVYSGFFYLFKKIVDWISIYFFKESPKARKVGLVLVLCFWGIGTILYIYFSAPFPVLFIALMTVSLGIIMWKELSQYWNVGLIRLDKTIEAGVDYQKALKLCTNQLDFLGIGASKLTASTEFEPAIRRCNRSTVPIRFLLTKPSNPLLIKAAMQRGEDPQVYQRRVSNSLTILQGLHNVSNLNIEVRFYPSDRQRDMPLFRLMFINNSICLSSVRQL